MKTLVLLILLAGCSKMPDTLTPHEARLYGVQVEDGAPITGTVVISEFHTLAGIEDRCGAGAQACTVAIEGRHFPSESHQYAIYYAEGRCAPYHEAAHAMYETDKHTVAFNIKWMQGNKLAACP